MLAGSFGFTLIHHSCFHCGTDETIATLTVNPVGDNCCSHKEDTARVRNNGSTCSLGECDNQHHHSTVEPAFSDDCCTHEAERIATDELVRDEEQNEIIPYFQAAAVIAVMDNQPVTGIHRHTANRPVHCSRDLTIILCRLQS